jgi:hypothetical protein
MSEYKETVTTSHDEGVSEAGANIEKETRKVDTSYSASGRTTATNIVWFLVGTITVLLSIRFVLKLLGANPNSSFVNVVYSITNVLTAPFDTIFGVTRTTSGEVNSVFEPSIIVAALIYALLGWGIVKLINLNRAEA